MPERRSRRVRNPPRALDETQTPPSRRRRAQRRPRFQSPLLPVSPINQPDFNARQPAFHPSSPRLPSPRRPHPPRPSPPPPRPSARETNQAPPRVSSPKLHGNTKEGRAERVLWKQYQERQAAANERARQRRQKYNEEWEAEIAQFGLEEARKRRLEEIQVNKEMDKLTTSDAEMDEIEERVSNPELTIQGLLRVNSKLTWSSSFGVKKLGEFSIWAFEQSLQDEIVKRNGHTKGWEIVSISVIIKSKHSRSKRVIQTIDNFTESEWGKVIDLVEIEARKWSSELDLRIEVQMNESKDQTTNLPSDSEDLSATMPRRRTRTDQLLQRQHNQTDVLADASDFDIQLVRRWQCHDTRCINNNSFCFVDDNLHYDLDHRYQKDWAKALARGDVGVTVEDPPRPLYGFIMRQGPVSLTSKKSKAQEVRKNRDDTTYIMDNFMDFSRKQLEMQMQERMMEQMSRMNERMDNRQQPPSIPQYNQYPSPWMYAPPPPSLPLPPPPLLPPPQNPSSFQVPPPHPPSNVEVTTIPTRPSSRTQARSSPIGLAEDEDDILEDFFVWKRVALKKQSAKDKLEEVRVIVEREMWTVDDLKEMSRPDSFLYQRAMQLGIPDGLARGFRADFRAFKPLWRQVNKDGD